MVVLVVILVLLRGNSSSQSSPTHESTSDAPDGTSALRAYAQAMGHSTGTIEGDFSLPSASGLLFIFTPGPFNSDEVQQVNSWLSSGGVVVYAAEDGDPQVDAQFALRRSASDVPAAARAAAPILGGVQSLSGATTALAFSTSAGQVPLFRGPSGAVLALEESVGHGELIALTDPLVLCNGYLNKADNGRLAADLFALTPPGGSVLFDEFHHGAIASQSPETDWMTTPWGLALLSAVLIVFAGLAIRGRGFGPTISLRPRAERSSAEYATAVGGLLHRTGARRLTLDTLLAASRRAVAERVGLGSDTPLDQIETTVAQRAPQIAAELKRAQQRADQAADSETELLDVAKKLHTLAYPLAPAGVEEKSA
jgi:hypothetical protein